MVVLAAQERLEDSSFIREYMHGGQVRWCFELDQGYISQSVLASFKGHPRVKRQGQRPTTVIQPEESAWSINNAARYFEPARTISYYKYPTVLLVSRTTRFYIMAWFIDDWQEYMT
jgi:hypothetical protein